MTNPDGLFHFFSWLAVGMTTNIAFFIVNHPQDVMSEWKDFDSVGRFLVLMEAFAITVLGPLSLFGWLLVGAFTSPRPKAEL